MDYNFCMKNVQTIALIKMYKKEFFNISIGNLRTTFQRFFSNSPGKKSFYQWYDSIGMYPEFPPDRIFTGRIPHQNFMQWWFRSLLPGIPTAAQLTSRLLMYFNLALQRHYEDKLHFQFKGCSERFSVRGGEASAPSQNWRPVAWIVGTTDQMQGLSEVVACLSALPLPPHWHCYLLVRGSPFMVAQFQSEGGEL